MGKFFCPYCETHLIHSSVTARKQHNAGRKHINAKIEYWQALIKEQGIGPPVYLPDPRIPAVPPVGLLKNMPGMMPKPGMGGALSAPDGKSAAAPGAKMGAGFTQAAAQMAKE